MLKLKIEQAQANKFANKMWQNVQTQFKRIITQKGLKNKHGKYKFKLTSSELIFLNSINNETKLKEILSANISTLRDIIDDLEPKISNNLKEVFYNAFISNMYSTKKFDGLKFVKTIGLQTCPYCNRAYIQSVKRNGVVRPEIDHFFPKDKYPYLGLSFYNLIPSCSVCNGTTTKGNRDSYHEKLISPYEISDDNFKFSFDIESTDNFPPKLIKKIDINDEYFKLEDFYKHHGDVIYELYTKIYREDTKEHFDALGQSLKGIGFDEAEIHRFITCGYLDDEDLHKRPLSKLIKDISEELKLI